MAIYTLSPAAQSSLKRIKAYSIKQFGNTKTKEYLIAIRQCMNNLAENPLQGLARKDLKAGYYSFFVGSHTIYYKIQPTHIAIIDILHQSMEPSKHIF